MPFTGKATYSAGVTLPELAEDVSDIIGIVSPFETPLLDHLGDARRAATSTVHEWLEDALLPNTDAINQTTFTPNPTDATTLTVDNAGRFKVGDQVRPDGSSEIMLVVSVSAPQIVVERGYGGTTRQALFNDQKLFILGNAAIEGADVVRQAKPDFATQNRTRHVRSESPAVRFPRTPGWLQTRVEGRSNAR